jgi:predicted nucleic acid-binding protein
VRRLLLDACVLINMFATGRFVEIAQASGVVFAVVREVTYETFYLRSNAEGAEERTPVSLRDLQSAKQLDVIDLEGPELADLVTLATRLDEGEAATLACARHRRISVATDDKAALRILADDLPEVSVLRTSELMRIWAEGAQRGRAEVADALELIQQRASFQPPADDPESEWWDQARRILAHPGLGNT